MSERIPTLQEAIELFLGEHIATTAKSYRLVLSNMAGWLGQARPLDKISPQDLIEYVQSVEARPAVTSPATLNRYVKTLKTFWNWCQRLRYIEYSPADALKHRRTGRYIRRDKAMKPQELEALLDYVKWQPRRHALILFLADTACRATGAAGLKIEDIDFETRSAVVTEKGSIRRKVYFGDDCAAALLTWISKRAENAGPYVFNRDGKRIQAAHISQCVRRACLKVGIRSLGSHSLRHMKGHALADSRVAPSVAAGVMGHASPGITMEFYYPKDDVRVEKAARDHAHGATQAQPGAGQPARAEQGGKILDFPSAAGE